MPKGNPTQNRHKIQSLQTKVSRLNTKVNELASIVKDLIKYVEVNLQVPVVSLNPALGLQQKVKNTGTLKT